MTSPDLTPEIRATLVEAVSLVAISDPNPDRQIQAVGLLVQMNAANFCPPEEEAKSDCAILKACVKLFR